MKSNRIRLISSDKKSEVNIENGELIGYQKEDLEYIHQKGNKGWRKSDDEMFPIIGPTSKNNFVVHTQKGDAIQDQHGLLRELNYMLISKSENAAVFEKVYQENALINNSKFPEKSDKEHLFWPFDFQFQKQFFLTNNELLIKFIIISEKGMPFMLGYHPAFLLSNTGKETIESKDKKVGLAEVYKAGANAYPFFNTHQVILHNTDKKPIEITTEGFDNFMLWTEVDNMLCIEPITQYTSYTNQKFSEENMRLTEDKNEFCVTIKVLDFE